MAHPPSPRDANPELVAKLVKAVPPGIPRVGVFVDPDDEFLARVLAKAPLDMLQLHGEETPARVAEIKSRFGKNVMKAIKVAAEADVQKASAYSGIADWLMFDARPPKDATRPGGNALAFDWNLLRARRWTRPWMLSGGLKSSNLGEAVSVSGAAVLDVSSGVESAPGVKDIAKIRAFLAEAGRI